MASEDTPSPTSPSSPPEESHIYLGDNAQAKQVAAGRDISQTYIEQQVLLTTEQAYDVRGLPNPYLGLASFSYADRAKYAGRAKHITETVTRMTAPGAALALLFVTGASGSGKSSFAQAGLVPALEAHYATLTVKHAVFRPGREPLAALSDALWRQLGLPLLDIANSSGLAPQAFAEFLGTTPVSQINLLVIDQFEEFFTQSTSAARESFFELFSHLSPFSATRTHILATLRADYLPELFRYQDLYDVAKQGVDLRAMTVDELRDAIQQPLRAVYPNGEKRFEPELVEKLAQDTAPDAAYLPLLQVTLEEIWRKGVLRLTAYGSLADAIEQRAEQVLHFRDYDAASPRELRSTQEQNALLDMLLNLVDVSLDDEARRDVRRQRSKQELAHGDPTRARWIDELAAARLLSVAPDPRDPARIEVDLIHETVLANWDQLRGAIAERRQQLRQRTRFEQNLDEWSAQKRSADYLLEGVRLAEAHELEKRHDIALEGDAARDYLRASMEKEQAERERELELERQRTTALKQRARILRIAAIVASGLFLLALLASIYAFQQQNEAVNQARAANQQANARATAEKDALAQRDAANEANATAEAENLISQSRRLAAEAGALRQDNLDTALLLAAEATKLDQNFESRNNLFTVLQQTRQMTVLYGHTSYVDSVAFSPDGKTLASGSWDNTIRLWDVASGKPIGQPFTGHESSVKTIAVSPDGKTLASGSSDKTIRLWDMATGRQIGPPLTGHTSHVHSIAFSPDGITLASGGWDNTVRLWDVASGQELGEPLTGHTDYVESVAFSPDGRILASGSDDKTIRLWDVDSAKQIGEPITLSRVTSVAFSPDGKLLVSGHADRTIRLWDIASRKQVGQSFVGHTDEPRVVVFSPDGTMLASSSYDRTVRVWDVASGQEIGEPFIGHTDDVRSVAFSPNGERLASGGWDQTIRLWDLRPIRLLARPLRGHSAGVLSLAFRPDGKTLVSASDDQTVRQWDVSTGTLRGGPLFGHSGSVLSVAVSPDGKLLASGGTDNTIRLWDAVDGKPVGQPLSGHADDVAIVAFSPDGKLLASGSNDKTVRLWQVPGGQPIGSPLTGFESGVDSVAFSPDGKWLAAGSWDHTIRVWDVATLQPISRLTGHTSSVITVAFSPDSKTLASGSWDKTIRLWDVAGGKQVGSPLTGHTDLVYSVAFSPDGNTLASGSIDDTVRLWDVASGRELGLPLSGHTDYVHSVAFSPDGTLLASASDDKSIRLWDVSLVNLSVGAQQARACHVAYRNLTRAEWAQYLNPNPSTYDSVYAKNPTCPELPLEPLATATPAAGQLTANSSPTPSLTPGPARTRIPTRTPRPTFTPTRTPTPVPTDVFEPALNALEDAENAAAEGNSQKAAQLYTTAVQLASQIDSANANNNICWNGSLDGFAQIVLPACERAVNLSPDDMALRDSRGLARALTGNKTGAIEDFTAFIEWAKTQEETRYTEYAAEREQWIATLKAGGSPFDAETLQHLRNE